MDKMKMESVDLTANNIDKIAEIFPNCITEMLDEEKSTSEKKVYKKVVNFDLLKQMLSNEVVEGEEAYEFKWAGKKSSIIEANRPIHKVLRPCIEESVNFDETENLYIEGDNLDVLKLLQESYLKKIKMIYIDPPYNTGNDFIYNDDFKVSEMKYSNEIGDMDSQGNRLFKNTESNGRFHSDWCSMIYSRLLLARKLLSDEGVIFISIDSNELFNLKKICDEVFGECNFVTNIVLEITKTQGMKVKAAKEGSIVKNHEYVLVYTKNSMNKKIVKNVLYDANPGYDKHFSYYIEECDGGFELFKLTDKLVNTQKIAENFKNMGLLKSGTLSISSLEYAIEVSKDIKNYIYKEIPDKIYQEMACNIKVDEDLNNRLNEQKIVAYKGYLLTKTSGGKIRQYSSLKETLNISDEYNSEYTRVTIRGDLWKGFYSDMMNVTKEGDMEFKNGKKPIRLIMQLSKWIGLTCDDTILDFFSGSATTAHAIMKMNAADGNNRKYIMVQTPEMSDEKNEINETRYKNICEIGKERIRLSANRITDENKMVKFDSGFRVLKLDDSNMKDVYYSADKFDQGMLSTLESNIKEDRTDLDLLFSCLLEWGLPLSLPYSSESIEGCTVHDYNDGDLIACFNENIPDSVIKEIAKKQPLRAVFRDSSFANSPSKINVGEVFKLLSPDTRVKVI